MRIFITGATGYIGTAVTSALVNSGHEVSALVRNETDSSKLERSGVRVIRGELRQIEEHTAEIGTHDAAIHTASDPNDQIAMDKATLDVLLGIDGLRVVYTSGVWVFGSTGDEMVDEDSPVRPIEIVKWRPSHEQRVLAAGDRGSVIRPGCVYGGSQSLLAEWFAAADRGEPLELIGDGLNRWAMVHQDDLADLYLKVVEAGESGIFHGVDDTRATLGQMGRAIIEARDSESEIRHKPFNAAKEAMGPFADALAIDQQVSSMKTRKRLDWEPSVDFVNSIERQWEEWRQTQ